MLNTVKDMEPGDEGVDTNKGSYCELKMLKPFTSDTSHGKIIYKKRKNPNKLHITSINREGNMTETGEGKQKQGKFTSLLYLYLKLEPLLNSNAFCIVLGSSGSLKKAWYSTLVFQKDLHTSRLAMENSRVSLHEGWAE